MSTSLIDNGITIFSDRVHLSYQDNGKLRETVRYETCPGKTYQFPTMQAGIAQPSISQADVVPMNIQQSNVKAQMSDWEAAEYTSWLDQAKVNYSEKTYLAINIGKAIARREDQIVIDAINSGSATSSVAKTVGGNQGMNLTKIRQAARLLDDLAVDEDDRWIAWTPAAVEQMLGVEQVTSSDYNIVKGLVNGDIDSYVGFKFKKIAANRAEGGLPISGTDRTCFAYQKAAVGLAVNKDMSVRVDPVPEKKSDLSCGLYSAGAIVIDPDGIVKITYDESVVVNSEPTQS